MVQELPEVVDHEEREPVERLRDRAVGELGQEVQELQEVPSWPQLDPPSPGEESHLSRSLQMHAQVGVQEDQAVVT